MIRCTNNSLGRMVRQPSRTGGRKLLETVTATEFVRVATQGRTGPAILTCEDAAGNPVELFCKVSGGCDAGVSSLARESVGACLAADLGLPIPRPYLVDLSPEFADTVPDDTVRQKLLASSAVGFGSLRVPNQFAVWAKGNQITDTMVPDAAAILVFDAVIQNPDRRDGNPNCLVKGEELRVFDHELAFMTEQLLFWTPPWKLGGLSWVGNPGAHIFASGLKGREIDYDPIKALWSNLSDTRLTEYQTAIPEAWAGSEAAVQAALKLIRDARDNIDGCLNEVRRILT